jgi:MSHA biogenesis protein MshP
MNAQRGVSLVSALFLVVVLAALAAFGLRIGMLQQQTVTSSLRAMQAMQAARSGLAWAAYRALASGACASATLVLTEGAAAGFTVDVSCTETAHVEGTALARVFVLDAHAYAGAYGGPDYVSRHIQSKIVDGA